ncbi:hypothetical protein LCGC14_1946420, partial [marine sediment metagenome]
MFKEEPLDRFRHRALALAPSMGFSAAQVNESLGIILNSLGAEWVSEQVDTIRRGDPLPIRVHPIGGLFATPGEPQVAEVLELAEYLRLVATSSALPEVLANLRAQYRSTLLQLAFAFRFAQLSEETPLLEPPVQGGRVGDLDVTVHGNRYLVECYAPMAKLKGESSDEVQWLTHRSIEVVKDRDRVFSIAIALDAMPSAAERKLIVRAVKRLADQLEAQDWDGTGFPPTRLYVGENATVSVGLTVPTGPGENHAAVLDRAFPRFGEEPTTLVAVRMATRAEILEFTRDTPPGEARDHVA